MHARTTGVLAKKMAIDNAMKNDKEQIVGNPSDVSSSSNSTSEPVKKKKKKKKKREEEEEVEESVATKTNIKEPADVFDELDML